MIVRIATEGQYRIPSAILDRINEIDNRLVQLVADGDQADFAKTLDEMLSLVRKEGTELDADELVASDIILPAPDTTLDEARTLFTGAGLIPG